jgi:hypothetical protein
MGPTRAKEVSAYSWLSRQIPLSSINSNCTVLRVKGGHLPPAFFCFGKSKSKKQGNTTNINNKINYFENDCSSRILEDDQ